jgi:DNA processing protein
MKNTKSENLKLFYFLKNISSLGDVRIRRIAEKYNNLSTLFSVDLLSLKSIDGISDKICQEVEDAVYKSKGFEESYLKLLESLDKSKIKVTTLFDDDYPQNLKNIYDAPVILFYYGNLNESDRYSISIVGTRTPSDYGRKVCKEISKELAKKGIPVISGLAIGIDSIAHNSCLESGGLTYAVLGSGVDNLYPPDNINLYEKIKEYGAVISEFDLGSKAEKVNFPRRNRVVSGISLGTVIVESRIKGGSLITAEFALDQNRELFAIPGNINSRNSEGCNNLIKKGYAKLILGIDDILSEFNLQLSDVTNLNSKSIPNTENLEMNVFESKIYNVLNDTEPINIDKICELTSLNISDCLVNLLTMEFKGLISQLPGKYFIKT